MHLADGMGVIGFDGGLVGAGVADHFVEQNILGGEQVFEFPVVGGIGDMDRTEERDLDAEVVAVGFYCCLDAAGGGIG